MKDSNDKRHRKQHREEQTHASPHLQKEKNFRRKTERIERAGRRRSYLIAFAALFLAGVLLFRLYKLQIIDGDRYQAEFKSRIRRTVVVRGSRGRILDRNGKVLAETKSSYNITMNDLTDDSSEDNRILNDRIREVIRIVDENDDTMFSDFSIRLVGGSYYFKEMGQTAKARFLADVYGYADPADMSDEELQKSPEDVVDDLADRYGISSSIRDEDRKVYLEMVVARYNLSLNYYQKYISTVLAKDISGKTKAAIEERFSSSGDGVQVEEQLVRYYHRAKYLSNIIGYTGEASEEYLSQHEGTDEKGHPVYREGDTVGLTGIEASQEEILHAKSGQETFNVDNIGRVTSVPVDNSEVSVAEQSYAPVDGRDVWLTIDRDLQVSAYRIIENNLRNIILAKLQNSIYDQVISEDQDGSSIGIPISSVYTSCLCNVIDSTHFSSEEASDTEREVLAGFESFRAHRCTEILTEIRDGQTVWESLDLEMQTYQTLLAQSLFDYGIVTDSRSDSHGLGGNDVWKAWEKGKTSLHELLTECIRKKWIDTGSRYLNVSDSSGRDEIYDAVMDFFAAVIGTGENAFQDRDMRNALYKYLIISQEISGDQVCRLLLDQKLVEISEEEQESFDSEWGESAFTFMYNRIQNLDLTPAQLHLYPSTASVVVTDPDTGDVLAMVSYPGFDTNRINDESYYKKLLQDPANPLLNYATQQLTAPGSTFKMVTATAALSEEVVTLTDKVNCKKKSKFTKVKEDPNPPKCWIYPKKHGKQNLEGAIANSCNMYFYEMGYRLGTDGTDTYNSNYGIERLQKYASLYGLDSTSGVEVSESEPRLLSGDPIRGAIGQDTNAFTTASLARYVSTVANSGTDYRLTLIDRIGMEDGTTSEHEKYIENTISLEEKQWDTIHRGMRRVATGYSAFNVLWEYPVAGKTGTAQQTGMPDNALFVGYAPFYERDAWNAEEMSQIPKIALAVRIPNGYTSTYAAQLASDVIRVFYDPDQVEEIVGR